MDWASSPKAVTMITRHFKHTRVALAAAGLLAGCTSTPLYSPSPAPALTPGPARPADSTFNHHDDSAAPAVNTANMSLERYKRLLAQRIAELNPSKVYPGNPQAMLRSVIVIKYVVDANGKLVSADTLRSNGDGETVSTALGAIRHAAPFPAPPHRLLNRGHLEILETMLFNDDGRFQMRSIAAPQLDE
jgi:protein TonB